MELNFVSKENKLKNEIFILNIFALYFYILVKYYLHDFERTGTVGFLRTHLEFYSEQLRLLKLFLLTTRNNNRFISDIQSIIDDTTVQTSQITYKTTDILVGMSIGILCFAVIMCFALFKDTISKRVSILSVVLTILINACVILGFEFLFLFHVYGNTDLINIAKFLGLS